MNIIEDIIVELEKEQLEGAEADARDINIDIDIIKGIGSLFG